MTAGAAARGALRLPGRLVVASLLALLWVYRNTISPMRGPTCRYHPSCSAYAVQSLQVHGAAKGTALAAARVCRCHPWADGGLDPVPPRGRWRSDPADLDISTDHNDHNDDHGLPVLVPPAAVSLAAADHVSERSL